MDIDVSLYVTDVILETQNLVFIKSLRTVSQHNIENPFVKWIFLSITFKIS